MIYSGWAADQHEEVMTRTRRCARRAKRCAHVSHESRLGQWITPETLAGCAVLCLTSGRRTKERGKMMEGMHAESP